MFKAVRPSVYTALVFGLALAAFAEHRAMSMDAALMLLPTQTTSKSALFRDQIGRQFRISGRESATFTPSVETKALAHKHFTLHGALPRVWCDYIPNTQGPMPLVILLHGAGRDGLSQIEMWRETADLHGVALVAPNSFGQSWDLADPEPAFFAQIVETIAGFHNIDRNRIFLFGHSDGAAYAQLLLMVTQGPWRAAALHAGYAPSVTSMAGLVKPYRLYIGENEQIFSVSQARAIGQKRAAQGQPNDLILIPRHDHWFYSIGSQIAEDVWGWFASLPH